MDLIEQMQSLSVKIQKQQAYIQTEEATKNAFVLPFIAILGYDVFDPSEVVPEFTADIGIKKGEKVDYAIVIDKKPIMLIECKKCGTPLESQQESQLQRYFSSTDARIAVLTDGIVYRFYTDLEVQNRMDSKPFMEMNMLDLQEQLVSELKRLTKPNFDLNQIITNAGELKYTNEIKRILAEQLVVPSDDLVRFFASQVYTGKLTQTVREQFEGITKRALTQFTNDLINDRLKAALTDSNTSSTNLLSDDQDNDNNDNNNKIVTTVEELEGYYIVKAILCDLIEPGRISMRDTQSYFGILLDDNNRKPICRLHFNRSQKYIGLFDSRKREERVAIEDLNDIYKYMERLRSVVNTYEKLPTGILEDCLV
ncbi:MAG: type I restriction endonuclease [Chloroflexota bacterium]|nr:type I restriction endonuclease [Chloroflexota bacterium]